MNKITLRLHKNTWMATVSGPDAYRIVDLFGTTTIPTAFTSQADPGDVMATIRNLNPGFTVEMGGF